VIQWHLHVDRAKQVGGVGESCTGDRLANVSTRGVQRKDTYNTLITVCGREHPFLDWSPNGLVIVGLDRFEMLKQDLLFYTKLLENGFTPDRDDACLPFSLARRSASTFTARSKSSVTLVNSLSISSISSGRTGSSKTCCSTRNYLRMDSRQIETCLPFSLAGRSASTFTARSKSSVTLVNSLSISSISSERTGSSKTCCSTRNYLRMDSRQIETIRAYRSLWLGGAPRHSLHGQSLR